eukprot:403357154
MKSLMQNDELNSSSLEREDQLKEKQSSKVKDFCFIRAFEMIKYHQILSLFAFEHSQQDILQKSSSQTAEELQNKILLNKPIQKFKDSICSQKQQKQNQVAFGSIQTQKQQTQAGTFIIPIVTQNIQLQQKFSQSLKDIRIRNEDIGITGSINKYAREYKERQLIREQQLKSINKSNQKPRKESSKSDSEQKIPLLLDEESLNKKNKHRILVFDSFLYQKYPIQKLKCKQQTTQNDIFNLFF